jgi:sugar lactone lactonase YvrE
MLAGCTRFGFEAPLLQGDTPLPLDLASAEPGVSTDGPLDLGLDWDLDLGDDTHILPDTEAPTPDLPASQPVVTTLAGTGAQGNVDGPAGQAKFNSPHHLAVDSAGRVYVADYYNHTVRKIENGVVSTIAGDGYSGFQDGPVGTSRFDAPSGIAVDSQGKVYVAEFFNHRIRLIASGVVSTLAGTGAVGLVNGPAATATFKNPEGLLLDAQGRLYVTDFNNHAIRVLDSGMVSTLAGTGAQGFVNGPVTSAKLNQPHGLALGPGGEIYIAEMGNHAIRVLDSGAVSTLAGSGLVGHNNGPAASAAFNKPGDVAVDSSGRVYVADSNNHAIRVIENGIVGTLAGGFSGYQDGPLSSALFVAPMGLALGPGGDLYVAEWSGHRIRVISGLP